MAVILTTAAEARRISLPAGVFYYQPAASVFGTEGAWINPANLAVYRVPTVQLLADYHDDRVADSWGWAANSERMASAYRRIEVPDGDDYQEYLFASGVSLGDDLRVGTSYRYYKEAPDNLLKQHFWTVGLSGGGGTWRWGAVFSNLNHAVDQDGERTETEMVYSLAYRPSSLRELTFATDMRLSTGMRSADAHYVYYAEYMTNNGIYISGGVDSHKNYTVGVRVNLLRNFLGSRSNFDRDGGHQRTTMILGSVSGRQNSVIAPRPRRLVMDMPRSLPENPARPVFGSRSMAFAELLLNIYRASEDPTISEMVLKLDGIAYGFGRTQELRAALKAFQAQGKSVTCHIHSGGNLDYYLASAADRILMSPVSQLRLVGLRAELTFYGGTLEKIGARPEILKIGDYKTAAETYTRQSSTEANREQINRLLDDLFDQFVVALADGRGVSSDSMASILDQGPFTPPEALAHGLIDGLCYADDRAALGLAKAPTVSFRRYVADTLINDGWPRRPVLAIVVADGEIDNDRPTTPFSSGHNVTVGQMRRAFDQAEARNVRGILLRINSPGGLALAGADISHVERKIAERFPLTVSMANVAASGGYHIATPGSRLFANPASITGSIGIFGGKPNLEGLYEKIDLGKELYTRGRYAGMLTWMRPFSDDERAKYYDHLESFYDRFLEDVAESRSVSVDSVDALAQGRVWTGREALANGLVDELGGLKQALDDAASRLHLDEYDVEIFPRKHSWFEFPGGSAVQLLSSWLGLGGGEKLAEEVPPVWIDGIYARLPYVLTIE
jgi:protease-4